MNERIREIARKMGAEIVAQLPDTAHGALGAAHYTHFYRMRMEQLRRQEQGLPSPQIPQVSRRLELSVSQATEQALGRIAEVLGKIDQSTNSAAVAAELLESLVMEMTAAVPSLESEVSAEEGKSGPATNKPSTLGEVLWAIMTDIAKRRKQLAQPHRQIAG
jgi:hypothetical protein